MYYSWNFRDNSRMSQLEKPPRKDFITKEIFILVTPILASYLWTIFYEAGYAQVFGIPHEFISLKLVDVLLANRLTLIAATLAFLWIGIYYNLLPTATSMPFKVFITFLLVVSIALGFSIGHIEAITRSEFLVTNTNPPSAVLRIYGDMMVTAPFDKANKTVLKSFSILRTSDDPKLSLTLQEIGPLTPQTAP